MDIEDEYSEVIIERGKEYLSSVIYCIKINNKLYGKVQGSRIYETEIDLDDLDGNCSCPYGTNCKHAVALYLNYKKGEFSDSKEFITSLDKMSNKELIELILSKLKDNPEWIFKFNIRKSVSTEDFVKSFKKNFSSQKIEEAEALLPKLSFEQTLELQDYIENNYDSLEEDLIEDNEPMSSYDYWGDEEYDNGLDDLNESLKELIIKKSKEKNKINEIIKRDSFREEIISNAEEYKDYKEKIKKEFSKEEHLEYLINLKNPAIDEIMKNINNTNKSILYSKIDKKTGLIKEISKRINDKTLIFSVAVYEKDFENIIKYFDHLEDALRESHTLSRMLKDIVNTFILKRYSDEKIAKKLLSARTQADFDPVQNKYLVSQIKDFDFIKNEFDEERLDEDIILLTRLVILDKNKTFDFINSNKNLMNHHWEYILILFKFLKKIYDNETIKKYIEKNQDCFKTANHLKNHLKDIGIYVSTKKDGLVVEIK
jgi:hypothetical protein